MLQHEVFLNKKSSRVDKGAKIPRLSFTSTELITNGKAGNVSLISQMVEPHTYGDITQSIASNILYASQNGTQLIINVRESGAWGRGGAMAINVSTI